MLKTQVLTKKKALAIVLLIGLVLLASNNLIATAEVTKLMAERNMYVER